MTAENQAEFMVVAKYIDLHTKRKWLESELSKVKDEMAEVEPRVIDHMLNNELQSLTTPHNTVYLHRQLWAGFAGEDRAEALDEMAANEQTEWLVERTVNSNRLSAFVRNDLPRDDQNMPILPDHMKGHIKVTERTSVRVRTK